MAKKEEEEQTTPSPLVLTADRAGRATIGLS